ncbi:longevity assurance proteins LAG1/LAC1 [Mycena albidolilacea]|uniref:Longevity assurance proteins LAG1/LAC1 n=1 Tax=Mycena albidolilacea TaxID=1033008 RepID=A0AAD7F4J3_9AGAR|nr:longevity assurance proteins LAG1/LAC1 [Mycena albidolilacea]
MSRQKKSKTPKQFTVSTDDPAHHFADPFQPQTPIGYSTPDRPSTPIGPRRQPQRVSPWLRWVIEPAESFKLLLVPLILYTNWELLTPHLKPLLEPLAPALGPYVPNGRITNPFGPIFLLSGKIATSDPDDPRYAKDWCDLLFLAYNVIFFSCFRQLVTVIMFRRIAKYFGIKKEAKLDRFGEQGYAVVYFGITGAWGLHIMSELPTWWYRTEYFWIDYPHWDMKPQLKRYYLMQMSYWLQQLIVLVLGLEKPRKDYYELVAHHIVTLWLVGWSYLINLTLIGNAVYMSMDIPDMALAFSKLLNYLQLERPKVISFGIFVCLWTYFRHYLNLVILWSVWTEFDLIPEFSKQWVWAEGTYLVGWMQYQVFIPIMLLQCINLFWYFLILRILVRTILISETDDDRSDDEGDDEGDDEDENTKENEKKPAADKKSRPLSRLREKETPKPSASKTATAAAK